MKPKILATALAAIASATSANASLSLSLTDGASPSVYSNGGGTGFGGTLGGASIAFDAVGSNLNISFTPGGSLNDIVAIFLNTRSGGFTDSQMNDNGDDGRRVISNLGAAGDDTFPDMGAPDFGIAIGSFGSVLFELNAGNTNNHLGFVAFENTAFGATGKQITVSLASLGLPSQIDWFAAYSSGTNFLSNESFAASTTLNTGGNPGFTSTATFENYNRFVVIPEPSAALLGGLGMLALLRRRRN
jgi:hypothetical protein